MGSEIELEPCAREYLLMKRGLYYRPDNMGYTGVREYAGRYLESDACPDDGVTAIHEDDAPEYSPACYDDLKIKRLQEQRGAQSTRIKELEEALRRLEQANNALCAKRSQALCILTRGGGFPTSRSTLALTGRDC